MKNKKIKLAVGLFFAGISVGNTIGFVVNLIISYCIGEGKFLPVMPQLEKWCNNQINAVALQSVLLGIIGAVFAEASFIFEIEKWSFVKQCFVHFCVTSVFYMPFVYICYTPKNAFNVVIMLLNIIFTYSLTWYLRYMHDKRSIELINKKIEEARHYDGYKNQRSDQEI